MIRSLFGDDENQEKPVENSRMPAATEPPASDDRSEEFDEIKSAIAGEPPEPKSKMFAEPFRLDPFPAAPRSRPELADSPSEDYFANNSDDLLDLLKDDEQPVEQAVPLAAETISAPAAELKSDSDALSLFQTDVKPESQAEIANKSGLAYSAAIALFGSVVFMLIIGWIFDSFLGTGLWCRVGGIFIGSCIGFYQFFRINSQIFKT
jgi:F0F1-type ATP synthase assembly protein I